jgi:cyclopropane-fatty-acyl-phospholipid synthase
MYLLSAFLKKLIQKGTLNVIDASGRRHSFVGTPAPEVTIRLHTRDLYWRLAFKPEVEAGEAYMDGRLTIEEGKNIVDFLDLALRNMAWHPDSIFHKKAVGPKKMWRWISQFNPVSRSVKNVAHHYDLSRRLYDLFLDVDRQYSCAYFASPNDTLDEAQLHKKTHIAAKLLLKPEQKVLDIGCGWGGMGLYLNKVSNANVTGITLSREQLAFAEERVQKEGVQGRVQFRLQDYRLVTEKFDRIVSVGMFEHVGVPQYATFFRKIFELLEDDGVALLHTIGRGDGPGDTNAWMTKYIFPGGYSPSLSEITAQIERAGLYITDIEVLRLHYAKTLREWFDRVQQNRAEIIALYDERFLRMWEFYLAASEMTFRYLGHVVYQIQLAKQVDTVPLTRDYIVDWERAIREKAALKQVG